MAESRPAGQTEGEEGNAQAVEAETGILGRVYGCCLMVQGWGQEDEGTVGAELDKRC